MTVVIAESQGQLFGFCSQQCAKRFMRGEPPLTYDLTPQPGCWLCGKDLTEDILELKKGDDDGAHKSEAR